MSRPRSLGWWLLGLPVLLMLLALVVVVQAKAFLKSDRFRTFLGGKVSETIHANGQFQTLEWNGTAFYSENFTAVGDPGASIANLEAQQLRGSVNLGGLWEKKWLIEDVELERLLIVPQSPRRNETEPGPRTKTERGKTVPGGGFPGSLLPNRVEIQQVIIANFQLDGRNLEHPFAVEGIKVIARPDGAAWLLEATGGNLRMDKIPKLTLDKASVRYAASTVFVNHADWVADGGGTLKINGEIPQNREKSVKIAAQVSRVPATKILPEDWRARLLGFVSADLQVEGDGKNWKATGPVTLSEGRLQALPVLEQIALFTRTQRFRQLNLDKVRADLTWERGRVTVKNLEAESPGLLRIRGNFVVENGEMKGEFLVGVAPASLRYIPGSQARVFSAEREGFLWTTMMVTGPVDHLRENLSERLAVAAGQELIDTIQKDPSKLKDTLKDAAKSLLDLFGK